MSSSSPTTTTRGVAAIRRLLSLAAGLAVALLGTEAALRVFRLAPTGGVATVTAKEYERVPGIFAPNQRVLDRDKPALPYAVRIDSLGFRGPDFSRTKPPGQLRVLMLGDSYVYGDFVDDNQTLPSQLEERLRGVCHDALVINAGLGGTTIVDQAFMLQRTLSLDPDVVVLVYVADDFQNLAGSKAAWELLAENRVKKSRFPLSVLYPLVRQTALWNLALRARAREVDKLLTTSLHQAYAQDRAGTIAHLRDRYGDALVAVRDTLEARGVPFVFAMFPAWRELPAASENLAWMERFADTHAIPEVSFLPALQASRLPATKLYLIPEDAHPSPLGYSIAADELAERILHGPLAPSSCQR